MSRKSLKTAPLTSQKSLNFALTAIVDSSGDVLETWVKAKQLLKPDDQLDLTEAELAEEITKTLTQKNPNTIYNLVIYSFKEGKYIPVVPETEIETLFCFEGTAEHIHAYDAKFLKESFISVTDSDASEWLERELTVTDLSVRASFVSEQASVPESNETDEVSAAEDNREDEGEGSAVEDNQEEDENENENEEEGETEQAAEAAEPEGEDEGATEHRAADGKKQKLINQFNYCERASLTYNNPSRSVETQTIPPPRSTYSANVLQWIIYDSYIEDYAQQLKEREKEKKGAHRKEDSFKLKSKRQSKKEELNRKYLQAWQIVERMINQNIFDEIAQDYRYYEDPSDEFREEEGTLLPLWKFSYEKTKKMNITDICFNSLHYDLFAVTYGSFDFMRQTSEGAVCLFTIKNPSFPDFKIMVNSGVMCCDIHPKYPYLLAIGTYDGNVAVYNLRKFSKNPIYISQGVNAKHSESVSEIKWGPDMSDGEINFYSISFDGRVFNWILMQNRLSITTIITLYLKNNVIGGPDGLSLKLRNCGTCMIFHPTQPEIFLIGTEEGLILKCNTAYTTKYLMTYDAHYLAIYRIDFNKYNSNIFASCSGDWRVKIWEDMRTDPLFVFDLGAPVGDVKWAPYSSTVFAAVTAEGKVFVFDLNVNKYKAICVQTIVPKRKNKLTRLAFNQKLPFIVVGDDRGMAISLKLSPNLRLQVKPTKKQQNVDQFTLQVQKLEKLLSLVRELPEGEEINDNMTTSTN